MNEILDHGSCEESTRHASARMKSYTHNTMQIMIIYFLTRFYVIFDSASLPLYEINTKTPHNEPTHISIILHRKHTHFFSHSDTHTSTQYMLTIKWNTSNYPYPAKRNPRLRPALPLLPSDARPFLALPQSPIQHTDHPHYSSNSYP